VTSFVLPASRGFCLLSAAFVLTAFFFESSVIETLVFEATAFYTSDPVDSVFFGWVVHGDQEGDGEPDDDVDEGDRTDDDTSDDGSAVS
jgi:hypothetical protein